MISTISTKAGTEAFVTAEAPPGVPFEQAFRALLKEYNKILSANGLGQDSAVFWRFHVSDIHTQADCLNAVLEPFKQDVLIYYVEQSPTSGSKVAIEAYHIVPAAGTLNKGMNCTAFQVKHGKYESLWGRLLPNSPGSSHDQTQEILDHLSNNVGTSGGTVEENVVRTWFYVRDIDNNYKGMVDARRNWFAENGMLPETHFIASTGIEGSSATVSDLVLLEYLTILGLNRKQITYMTAPKNMNPTQEYGVTFERGTSVTYGDRTHYYISGTASINNKGEVVHVGDVIKQTGRMIENVTALLEGQGASFDDMKLAVVYLRDQSDHAAVDAYLKEHFPKNLAYNLVTGCVCRPAWLIEMDGIAVSKQHDSQYAPFC